MPYVPQSVPSFGKRRRPPLRPKPRAQCRRMNSASNDLEAGFKSTLALSCRRFQPMAYRVRGAVGGRVFRARAFYSVFYGFFLPSSSNSTSHDLPITSINLTRTVFPFLSVISTGSFILKSTG